MTRDDNAGWTLNGTIQPYIDIYTSQTTFTEVQRSFPYLVSREFASGGGDVSVSVFSYPKHLNTILQVPEFKWHIIEDRIPFEIGETGIRVTPIAGAYFVSRILDVHSDHLFAVHHGRIFSQAPPPGNLPTPEYTAPSTPISGRSSPLPPTFPITHDHISDFHPTPTLKKIQPYLCFGFKIEEAIVYISDVSYIPEDAWSYLLAPRRLGGAEYSSPVFIVDCLRLNPHTSHFGLGQSIAAVRRLAARRSYLTGFGHEVSHGEYETILRAVGSELDQVQAGASDTESENVRKGLELVGTGEPSGLWVRPAFDGLRIVVHPDGTVEDDAY